MSKCRSISGNLRHCGIRQHAKLAVAAVLWLIARPNHARAGVDNWIGGTSDWNTPSNWDSGVVPGGGDTVNIINTDGTSPTITYDYPGPSVTLGPVTVSATGGTETFLMATAGLSLSTGIQYVGDSNNEGTVAGVGVFTQSAGNSSATGIFLGYNSLDAGTFQLIAPASFSSTGSEVVGFKGVGDFNQTGGMNSINGGQTLYVGHNGGSTGAYTLTGNGTLALNAGIFSNGGNEYIGYSGDAIFTQDGGANDINSGGALYIGCNFGSVGSYLLAGTGTLALNGANSTNEAGNEYIGYAGAGVFNQTGGRNTVAGSVYVGSFSAGIYNQSGGTNTINGDLYLGQSSASTAAYILSGNGTITAGNEYVADNGDDRVKSLCIANVNQSGGLNIIRRNGSLYLGDTGSQKGALGIYTLSGTGELTNGGNEYLGYTNRGTGSFIQSGGLNLMYYLGSTGDLYLGYSTGSEGIYSLSGNGLLVTDDSYQYVGYSGTGNFNQSGGTFRFDTRQLIIGYNTGSSGNYTLGGTGTLTANGDEIVGLSGTGNFTQTSGINKISGSLYLGNNTGSTGKYALGGTGILSAGAGESVGSLGNGSFIQSGGTNTISPNGRLSIHSGSSYTLSGGNLLAPAISIGSTGEFTQSGGSAIFTNLTGSGTATITGGITTLSLGGSPSQLGSLNIGGTGTLDLQLGGHTQGVNYDLINVTGASSLAGTLEVDLVNGFAPQIGDQFTVLTAGLGVSGGFTNLTSNNGLFTYTVDYGQNNNIAEITVTSVPEPASIGIAAFGGLGLLQRRTRRKRGS